MSHFQNVKSADANDYDHEQYTGSTEVAMEVEGTSYFTFRDGRTFTLRQHINPDGSPGGWVEESCVVPTGVVIAPLVTVVPGTTLSEGDVITTGPFYDGGVTTQAS